MAKLTEGDIVEGVLRDLCARVPDSTYVSNAPAKGSHRKHTMTLDGWRTSYAHGQSRAVRPDEIRRDTLRSLRLQCQGFNRHDLLEYLK